MRKDIKWIVDLAACLVVVFSIDVLVCDLIGCSCLMYPMYEHQLQIGRAAGPSVRRAGLGTTDRAACPGSQRNVSCRCCISAVTSRHRAACRPLFQAISRRLQRRPEQRPGRRRRPEQRPGRRRRPEQRPGHRHRRQTRGRPRQTRRHLGARRAPRPPSPPPRRALGPPPAPCRS